MLVLAGTRPECIKLAPLIRALRGHGGPPDPNATMPAAKARLTRLDLARWLVDQGIESMSLNPDTVVETWLLLAGKKA